MRIALGNLLAKPGAVTALGTPVDLGKVDVDTYVVAGLNDHIVPWENAYRSSLLLGGGARFILSTSGHIQALVNPPAPAGSPPRSSYRVADDHPPDADAFLERAAEHPGSWWPHHAEWLAQRSGELRPAPKRLGGRRHKARGRAPGSYVHAS